MDAWLKSIRGADLHVCKKEEGWMNTTNPEDKLRLYSKINADIDPKLRNESLQS